MLENLIKHIIKHKIQYKDKLCGFVIRDNRALRRNKKLSYDEIYEYLMESPPGGTMSDLSRRLGVVIYAYLKNDLLVISFTKETGKIISNLEEIEEWI